MTPVWREMEDHAQTISRLHLTDIVGADPKRFARLSFSLPGLLADFSKQIITGETLDLLLRLARDMKLERQRDEMLAGGKINRTENRAALHTALRAPRDEKTVVDGKNVVHEVHVVLEKMRHFSDAVRHGRWRGHSGQEITDIVSIGIGGSGLGPQAVVRALQDYHHTRLRMHFVMNVEASEMHHTLQSLSPETTLFIVASKTFTTVETLQNAHMAREKIVRHFQDEKAVEKHFVAISTNSEAVTAFGISEKNMFPFWDWVGGRFSVWSAIGLPVMLMIGPEHFMEFLSGAHEMDEHFSAAPLESNIPALMGLIGIWNRNFMKFPAYAVIPYHSALSRLPAWLQQLDMESNGKSVDKNGKPVAAATAPLIFGEPGTDAQHSFFQWLHQGTDIVPVDFIAAVKTPFGGKRQQAMLLANMLAQSEALMAGQKNDGEPHRNFTGNRPSTTILLDELTPRTLGMLMALYEHKIFVQGAVWNINSFDQFGVELGKALAHRIDVELQGGHAEAHDASTAGLIKHILSKQ